MAMSISNDTKSVLAAAGALVTSLFVMFKGVLNNAPPGTEQWNVPELLMLTCVVIFLLLMIFYRGRLTRNFVKRATWTTIAALLLGLLCYSGLIWQSSVNVFEYGGSRHIRGGFSEQGEARVQRYGSLETAINSFGGLAVARPLLWTAESERRAKYYLLGWYFSSSLFLAAAVLSAALLATILWRERSHQK